MGSSGRGTLPGDHPRMSSGSKPAAEWMPGAGCTCSALARGTTPAATPALDAKPNSLHQAGGTNGKSAGFFFGGRDDCQPHPLLRGRAACPYPLPISGGNALAVLFGIGVLYHGQIMLQTYPVRQPPEGKAGAEEVMEFPGAVKGRGIEIDVVVNVALVGMGADEKLVFRPAHRRFKAQLVCLVRRHLTGRERLPNLEEQSPALHGPGRGRLVFTFHQQKLGAAVAGSPKVEDAEPWKRSLRQIKKRPSSSIRKEDAAGKGAGERGWQKKKKKKTSSEIRIGFRSSESFGGH